MSIIVAQKGGEVLVGRDIGTMNRKRADVKLFVIATEETRARRKNVELMEAG